MMTITLWMIPLKIIVDIIYIYIWIYEPNNGVKYLVTGNNIVYLSYSGLEKGVIKIKSKTFHKSKIFCKGNEGVYFS